ncbi:MAG: cytochrome c [Proteobacteria bacterium]|nr:cytochrome c [Pseudomonadota bacterium]
MRERVWLLLVLFCVHCWAQAQGLGLGHAPSAATLRDADTAIGADGAELPPGSGSVAAGAALFVRQCAACHGAHGTEGPDPVLVGGQASLAGDQPLQTIGSYWPYATTVFDYIRRAMPFMAPGSLTDDEVYALTAFLLAANGIVPQDTVLDRQRLAALRMPNRDGFMADRRRPAQRSDAAPAPSHTRGEKTP